MNILPMRPHARIARSSHQGKALARAMAFSMAVPGRRAAHAGIFFNGSWYAGVLNTGVSSAFFLFN